MVKHLLACHKVQTQFRIVQKEGFQNLRDSIHGEVNVSGRGASGILADANDNIGSRWQSICDQLVRAGLDMPMRESPSPVVFSGPSGIRVGVWLMPDNQHGGELEDVVHAMIPENDPMLPRARRYINGIPEKDRKFANAKLTKAHVHAWLASCKRPRPMGTAISAGDLRHDVPITNAFVGWLRELFEFQATSRSSDIISCSS